MQGGSALVDPDDRAVWADYRDRRQFKPRFPIATITDTTTVEHLERVVATLALYRAPRGRSAW